jgi:hypothetical protein
MPVRSSCSSVWSLWMAQCVQLFPFYYLISLSAKSWVVIHTNSSHFWLTDLIWLLGTAGWAVLQLSCIRFVRKERRSASVSTSLSIDEVGANRRLHCAREEGVALSCGRRDAADAGQSVILFPSSCCNKTYPSKTHRCWTLCTNSMRFRLSTICNTTSSSGVARKSLLNSLFEAGTCGKILSGYRAAWISVTQSEELYNRVLFIPVCCSVLHLHQKRSNEDRIVYKTRNSQPELKFDVQVNVHRDKFL